MILLDKSLIDGLDPTNPSLPAVQQALQQAVELEHATIPPYLYALYSLIPGKNDAIGAIIQSVVVEEMLHMTLACNVLNAIGGAPDIDKPGFIPTYPGNLPGGVQGSLTVHLRPFSMEQLQTFLEIEEPEHPLVFKALALDAAQVTIGAFYGAIAQCITALGDSIFVPGPHHQVGPDVMYESVVVTDVASANQALRTIVEQGEGTATSPEELVGGGFAHYYRFQQIQKGHLLVKDPHGPDPDDQFSFTGAVIPFDPAGVYPLPDNPTRAGYSGQQAFENDTFNYTYTSLLKSLHLMFNGENAGEQFNRTIGLMMSLKGQVRAMAAGLPSPAPRNIDFVGPSFEYQPVNAGPMVQAA